MFRLVLVIIALILPSLAMSHSGGLNASGCHAGSKPYHCHRSASEMTKSSSGGNRLKCSAGSTSKDCINDTSNSRAKTTATYEDKSQTAQEIANSVKVMDADGEAITILGFNYDQAVNVALDRLSLRFGCHNVLVMQYNKCTNDPSVISWSLDAIGNISTINFRCEAFDGCTYSTEEIFEALTAKYKLTDNNISEKYRCGSGIAGEQICVSKIDKSITLQKDKFRQKPLNFD